MEQDIAVFTTRAIMDGKSNILEVYHDEDGDWQFMTGELVTEEDAKIVSLGQVLALDNSLNEILSLKPGYMAYRQAAGAPWSIVRKE